MLNYQRVLLLNKSNLLISFWACREQGHVPGFWSPKTSGAFGFTVYSKFEALKPEAIFEPGLVGSLWRQRKFQVHQNHIHHKCCFSETGEILGLLTMPRPSLCSSGLPLSSMDPSVSVWRHPWNRNPPRRDANCAFAPWEPQLPRWWTSWMKDVPLVRSGCAKSCFWDLWVNYWSRL